MFRLEHENGEPLLLPPDLSVAIGRGEQCDLQLNDPSVSRVHCRVLASGGRVTLTDVGSRWGTFVNGQKVTECDLRTGDRLTIGETILRLEAEGDPNRTTLAPRTELFRPAGVLVSDNQFATQSDEVENSPPPSAATSAAADVVDGGVPSIPAIGRAGGRRRATSADDSGVQLQKQIVQPEDFLGQVFHRYRVVETIAQTGSGIVFKAKETRSGQPLALKIYHPQFLEDETSQLRFERAARTMFGQRHSNIVELFNAGKTSGHCFTASQLIEGRSAVDLIRKIGVAGMLEPSTALQIAVDLCEALRFAEGQGIVHRNIKPSNILIRKSDNVALLNDLILAKASKPSGAALLTQAGDVLGDVCFMSPEQLGSGQLLDCRSDIYQLGTTLYALLSGRPPFDGGTFGETIAQVLTSMPRRVRDRHMAIPEQFDAVVLKMLEKNPRDRFQSADDLAAALRKVAAETGQQNVRPRNADPKATGWGGALDGLL